MNGTLYPDPNEYEHGLPPGVDPNRLSVLVEQALEFRDSGTESYIDAALANLSKDQREAYRPVLLDRVPPASKGDTEESPSPAYFGSIEELTRSLIETQESSDTDCSTDSPVGHDATIDVPDGFSASNHRVDLPPAKKHSKRNKKSDLPERVGKFLIQGELGRGAFGVVYLGFDEELQRKVAIKVSLVADPRLQEKLRIEASKVAQVESNGIVPVYHIGTTERGAFYIVQKYIKGSSLGEILKQGPLSPARAARLIRDIAFGLEAAHLRDILHRDLKPDNILVEESGRAWIADFGLAISEDEQTAGRRELAGTLPYMSPEQINGRIDFLDPRSDIWALGVMYYELLTGKLPFTGKTRAVLTEQICERDPRPLQQRAPGHLTEAMNSVFLRCCSKKPSDRFATVRELAMALDSMLASGLSDQNILGQFMEPRFGESTIEYATASSRFASGQSHSSQNDSSRTSLTGDSHPSMGSLLGPSPPWWLALAKSLLALVALIALSVLANVGYQNYTASLPKKIMEVRPDVPVITPPIDSLLPGVTPPVQPAVIGGDRNDAKPMPVDTLVDKPPSGDSATMPITKTPVIDLPPPIDADGSREKPWIVAADGTGSHRSLSEAIQAGAPGRFIRLATGLYAESIRITSPCTLIAPPREAPGDDLPCEIENGEATPITIDCPGGTVTIENLSIDGKGRNRNAKFNAIDVMGGTLALTGCELETSSQNCIKVHRGGNLDIRECHFVDSNEFSISTHDHGEVKVSNCLFDASGVQLVGGTGKILSSKFFGKSGVNVAQSTEPVEISNCTFSGNRSFALAATTGAKMIARECNIIGCDVALKAIESAANANNAESENDANGAKVAMISVTIEDCPTGVVVDSNSVVQMTKDCEIRGGDVGIGIGRGSLLASDMTIVDVREWAVRSMVPESNVELTNVNVIGSKQYAVTLMAGNANLTDVTIEGGRYGITWGDEDHADGMSAFGKLINVTIKENSGVGISAHAGDMQISNSTISGGEFGLFIIAPDATELSDPPAMNIGITRTKFTGNAQAAVQARGDARVKLDETTWKSIEASKGAKTLPPAEVVLPLK